MRNIPSGQTGTCRPSFAASFAVLIESGFRRWRLRGTQTTATPPGSLGRGRGARRQPPGRRADGGGLQRRHSSWSRRRPEGGRGRDQRRKRCDGGSLGHPRNGFTPPRVWRSAATDVTTVVLRLPRHEGETPHCTSSGALPFVRSGRSLSKWARWAISIRVRRAHAGGYAGWRNPPAFSSILRRGVRCLRKLQPRKPLSRTQHRRHRSAIGVPPIRATSTSEENDADLPDVPKWSPWAMAIRVATSARWRSKAMPPSNCPPNRRFLQRGS